MSNIQRSRSAPHVAPLQPFLAPRSRECPPIRRHHTTLALSDLASQSSSSRSGYQTPRADRAEDPFSLGGFFPSQLPVRPDADWNWLHTDEDEYSDGMHPAYGPGSDDEHDHDFPSRAVFDTTDDLETGEMILREDKLGVLSMSAMFSSATHGESHSTVTTSYDRLLSPYCEDNPLDNDAVYQSWSALRQAHTTPTLSSSPSRTQTKLDGCNGPLFSPVEDVKDSEYAEEQSMLSRGVGVVLDLLAF